MNNILKKGLLLFSILLSGTIISCGDDDNGDDSLVITVDDAAEYVAASMAIATYGAVYNMDYIADQIVDLINCNESESDTRTNTETSNDGSINLNGSITESYSRTCAGDTEVISYTFNANQTTTSQRLDTDTQILGSWTVGGADLASTQYTYNGNYTRAGDWTYNLQDDRIDNVTNSFVYTEVKSNKEDNVIFSGTATFSLVGTSTVYEPYSYEGDIVFQADNISIATFSTGEQYEIDLNTGDVTPL